MDLNRVTIIGRLAQDPEVRTTPSGQTVASFSVVTNYTWTDQQGQKQEKPEFHNIVAWRKLGEICGQYLQKGKQVYIEGRLQTRNWEGQDGVKRYKTEIVADNMIMLGSKNDGRSNVSQNAPTGQASNNEKFSAAAKQEPNIPTISSDSEDEIKIEDIPF